MLSLVIAIASLVALIAGVAYFVFVYGSRLIEFFNGIMEYAVGLVEYLPPIFLPFVGLALAFAVFSFLVKVL